MLKINSTWRGEEFKHIAGAAFFTWAGYVAIHRELPYLPLEV